jgi:uncharacterized protein (TIGR02270 family)
MRLPDFGAEDATRDFHTGLYLEHLEEASFLYEQRLGLYDDPEVTWLDIGEFEERLEAHIDALVLGEGLAVEICRRRAEEGETGELYAAVCVFCRVGGRDLLGAVLKGLDPDDAARLQAVSDAMKDEMPAEWAQALASGPAGGDQKLIPMLAYYLGYRRFAAGGVLDTLINRVFGKGLARLVWGLGRIGVNGVGTHVAGYLDDEDPAVRTNAVMALLRSGDARALAACRERSLRGDPAMYLPLSVSGERSDAVLLRDTLLTKTITPEALLALGVLGELGALQPLVDKLNDTGVAASAATALQLITGADLREEAFIPEVVTEDELFEDELQAYRETGQGPKHSDARPFGVSVNRTSQNPDDWRNWLGEHGSRFDPTLRYRLGKPFSLSTLVDTLMSPSCGRQVRSLAHEELVIRYGIDVAFEAEMRVVEQRRQIDVITGLCRSRDASFRPGQWYFAGRET